MIPARVARERNARETHLAAWLAKVTCETWSELTAGDAIMERLIRRSTPVRIADPYRRHGRGPRSKKAIRTSCVIEAAIDGMRGDSGALGPLGQAPRDSHAQPMIEATHPPRAARPS